MNQDCGKRSYYAVVPANVRYDKNLSSGAKLLYGEITALTNEKGYCWATNNYFAGLYDVSKVTISTWIKQLIENGYITSEIKYKKNSKEILKRYLKIVEYPIKEYLSTPIKENFKENITLENNTINNYNVLFEKLWKLYPNKKGKSKVNNSYKKILSSVGEEELIRAINRYKAELDIDSWRQAQNGYTFFTSGYLDYLDNNFMPKDNQFTVNNTARENSKSTNRFSQFPQRFYSKEDFAKMEEMLLNKYLHSD